MNLGDPWLSNKAHPADAEVAMARGPSVTTGHGGHGGRGGEHGKVRRLSRGGGMVHWLRTVGTYTSYIPGWWFGCHFLFSHTLGF